MAIFITVESKHAFILMTAQSLFQKPVQRFKKLLLLLSPIAVWFFGHIIYTVADGLKVYTGHADIAVILGSKVNEDGSLSERLSKRLECGLQLYNAKRAAKIVVSGGLGEEGHYEGDKMKSFLIQNGVPDSSIIVDNYGVNTRATVVNTMKLRDSLRFNSVVVVSQYFHLTRTKMLFRKSGLDNVGGASPAFFEFRDFYSLIREFVAFYLQ